MTIRNSEKFPAILPISLFLIDILHIRIFSEIIMGPNI